LQKSRELSAAQYDLEARNRTKEENLQALRKDFDHLRFSNASILERNDEFQAELDALNQHVQLLGSQNQGLNKELEKFVETDEEIRARLNRRDRVTDLRQKTEYELRRSIADLDRASPVRKTRA
jgi:predicted nuclease with TOPRIM domain